MTTSAGRHVAGPRTLVLPRQRTGLGSAAPAGRRAAARMPALDGLRAVAVLAVLVFHSGLLRAGYLGVDLFFVLSGFLITTILLGQAHGGRRISFRAFWVRRAVRLLPAVYLYLIAGAVLVVVLKGPADQADLAANGLATVLNANNWWRVHAPDSGGSWAGHLWSLSAEQQFYLVWPVVIGAAMRTPDRRRALPWLLLAAIAVVAGWRLLLVHLGASGGRIYFGTDTRADALLAGSLLAVLHVRGTLWRISRDTWRWAGALAALLLAALMIAGPALAAGATWMSQGGFTAVAASAAVLVAALVHDPRSVMARALSSVPLVWLGQISYGFYLWHFPVVAVLTAPLTSRLAPLGVAAPVLTVMACAVISTGLAWLSWTLVEQPVSRRFAQAGTQRRAGQAGRLRWGHARDRAPAAVPGAAGAGTAGRHRDEPARPVATGTRPRTW